MAVFCMCKLIKLKSCLFSMAALDDEKRPPNGASKFRLLPGKFKLAFKLSRHRHAIAKFKANRASFGVGQAIHHVDG